LQTGLYWYGFWDVFVIALWFCCHRAFSDSLLGPGCPTCGLRLLTPPLHPQVSQLLFLYRPTPWNWPPFGQISLGSSCGVSHLALYTPGFFFFSIPLFLIFWIFLVVGPLTLFLPLSICRYYTDAVSLSKGSSLRHTVKMTYPRHLFAPPTPTSFSFVNSPYWCHNPLLFLLSFITDNSGTANILSPSLYLLFYLVVLKYPTFSFLDLSVLLLL